ncbi:SPOR domain-containing protein [Afipia clevelandensis]|uniref:SPOR domain-containing protein n=1 Tax=Afipia clevelandensis ATCC 49720 TaxID=883079 RepID=K8PPT3_9BRAD|nr:SPOR domain-containing protein [Afipia clevelandensis]EKS40353.1 hypothetical protein HMPREF9696_00804 [Afipia clevelandensis ATCC 49720]
MANQYRDRPFPADDDYGRDQSRAPAPGESDPLAELARLIGQTDPLSTFGRDQQRQPQQYQPHDQYDAPEPVEEEIPPPPRPSWMQNLAAARPAPQEPAYREEPSYRDDQYAQQQGHYDPRYAQNDPAQNNLGYGHQEPQFDHSGYDPAMSAQGRGHQAGAGDRYDDVLYGRPDHDPAQQYGAQDEYYGNGAYDRPPYEETYEQESKPRRGGTMTVVMVLALAVVGTGAAFAYRTFIGSPRSGEPPVIKADAGPNKIIPPGASDGSSKQIYDRVGDKSAERVVSREEQPVDVNAKTGPRVVFPPLTQNASPPTVSSASPNVRPTGPGVGNGTLTGGEEPRKIRTLSIRPEQDANAAIPARGQPAPQQRAAPAPASTASTPPQSANAPVSLAPQAQPAPEPRTRTAAINPAQVTGAGAYVQVSSQKSEADAKASYKALQGKYAGILGSRSATIHRADVSGKGTFYRALVGPFATNDEATQFCLNLKSAGGQCIVQRR